MDSQVNKQDTAWTVRKILSESRERLAAAGIDSPNLEAEVLLAETMGHRKETLYGHPEKELTPEQVTRYEGFMERRLRREPIAYILGRREFWSLEFKVNPAVLIPRPETETLIEQLLQYAGNNPGSRPLRILDLGTGSGNIAVVAAREIPHSRVVAVDLSAAALAVARENSQRHGVADRILFVQGDLFQPFEGNRQAKFDIVLSNPPYIDHGQFNRLDPDVSHYEPAAALRGGPEGLDCYTSILKGARAHLHAGGALILEIGADQAGAVTRMMQASGAFDTPCVTQDYSGRDRVVAARRGHG